MKLCYYKFLIGQKVRLTQKITTNAEADLTGIGIICAIRANDLSDLDKDLLYDVKYGDWVIESIEGDKLRRE